MENKAHALAAGVFVLGVAALLVALAVWLTREIGDRREYLVSSPEAVTGLQPQAAVRFKGVQVGQVTAIGFDAERPGQVLIRLAVDASAPVTESTYASLGYQGVTGLAFVQLDDEGASKQPLRSADDRPARIPMRAGLVSRLTNQSDQLLAQLEEASRRLNQLLAPENQQRFFGAVGDVGDAARRVDVLAGHMDTLMQAQLSPARADLPRLVQETHRTVAEVGRAVQRLNAPGGVVDRLADSAEGLSRGTATFNANTLPRLHRVSDDASRAAQEVSRAVGDVSENPQSLLYGRGAVPPGPGEPGFTAPELPR